MKGETILLTEIILLYSFLNDIWICSGVQGGGPLKIAGHMPHNPWLGAGGREWYGFKTL